MSVRYDYSPTEKVLLELLIKNKRLDTKQLVEKLYEGREAPFHANGVVIDGMRSLIKKVDCNGEKFRIERSKPVGRTRHVFRFIKRAKIKS